MEKLYVFVEVTFEIRMFVPLRSKVVSPAMFETKIEAADMSYAK